MWYEERKGKFVFYERYKCPLTNKLKKVSIVMPSASRQMQKEALYKLKERIDKKLNSDPSKILLKTAIEEFYAHKSSYTKDTTIKGAKGALYSLLDTDVLLLSSLDTRYIQTLINEFMATHSNAYTRKAYGELRQVLQYAERMNMIRDISFLNKVVIPIKQKTREEIKRNNEKYLDFTELKQLLKDIEKINPTVALLCEFQALTGLRYGELTGLRIQDYDSSTSSIDINGSFSHSLNIRGTPKNAYSYRTIDLSNRAESIIKHFIALSEAQRKWYPNVDKNDYIFVTKGGKPINIQFVNKILKKVSTDKHISTHIFRHTHISMLVANNVPLKTIMARVGHNDPKTTLAIYTHVMDRMKLDAKKALADIDSQMKA